MEVEPLIDPESEDAKAEKNLIPLRVQKRLGEADPSIDAAIYAMQEEQKNAERNKAAQIQFKSRGDFFIDFVVMCMTFLGCVGRYVGRLFGTFCDMAENRKIAWRAGETTKMNGWGGQRSIKS